jgi:RHS repeat-associated protein
MPRTAAKSTTAATRQAGRQTARQAGRRSAGRPPPRQGAPARGGSPHSQARPTQQTPRGGDPISIVTGEVLLVQQDVSWPGILPLILERTHVSSYRAGRWFGASWASTLDQALEIDSRGVHFLDADASVRTYPQVLVPNLAAMPSAGPQHPLTLTSDGGYILADPRSGRTLHFPAPGEETGWSRLPLTAVTDRNGNRVDLLYHEGVLTEVRHSGGYRVVVDTAAHDRGGRRITALRAADGTVLKRFAYDPVTGDLTEVIDSSGTAQRFGYDGEHRLTGWVDRNGHWYRYTYDERGRAVRGEGTQGRLNATFTYEPDDHRTLVTDALGHTTVHRYNQYDQIVEETDPLGGVTRSEWDAFDRLLSRTDPLGHTTRFHYDERGNLTRVHFADGTTRTIAYNGLNLPTRVTQPDGAVWELGYDERGNLTRRTDPAGAVTVLTYDDRGGLVSVTDALGHTTRAVLNEAGLPLTVTDAMGGTHRNVYDAAGRLVRRTDPAGGVTTFTRTVEGRLASRTLPDGATERWRYDGEGNTVERTDALGRTTRTEYGPLDLPTSVVQPDGSRLTFTHDGERRLTAVTNGDGLTWHYTYDAAGRLISETDFNGRTVTYAFDAAGRLTARTNGAGQTVAYVRDPLGNVVEKTAEGRTTTYAHDAMGRLVHAAAPGIELRLVLDAVGRVITETCNGATTAYTRDRLGRVVTRRTPSGAETNWTYTPTGLPSLLRTAGHTFTFAHDTAGREIQRRIDASAALSQQWDAVGRLTAQALWAAPGPDAEDAEQPRLLQHRTYAFRPDGNLIGVTDRLAGDRSYELNATGRITGVTAQGWTERYAYDGTGNLTYAEHPDQEENEGGAREYAGTLVRSAGRTRYEHDGQGRVVLREQVTLSGRRRRWRFQWDADDRLVSVEAPGGSRWYYHYDPVGRRIAKQQLTADATALQTYTFSWDGSRLAEQTHRVHDRPDQALRATVWNYEPGSHKPLTQTERVPAATAPQEWIDRRFHAVVTDLVGTPTELVDPDGTVTATSFTTWGRATAHHACPLRLPGQYHDPETDLNYNFLRFYDPATGGYLSPDPLGMTPQPNPHAYVLNPTTWLDPLGLTPHNYGSGEPIRLYRSPERGNKESERFGLDARNHRHDPDPAKNSAHLGDRESVVRQYAGQGPYEDGYWVYTMKPEFLDDFYPAEPYYRFHDKDGGMQWVIDVPDFDDFNRHIDHSKTEWVPWKSGEQF